MPPTIEPPHAHSHDDESPEIAQWLSDGGADRRHTGPVTRDDVLEVLDFLSAQPLVGPIAQMVAAGLASAIRASGLKSNPSRHHER